MEQAASGGTACVCTWLSAGCAKARAALLSSSSIVKTAFSPLAFDWVVVSVGAAGRMSNGMHASCVGTESHNRAGLGWAGRYIKLRLVAVQNHVERQDRTQIDEEPGCKRITRNSEKEMKMRKPQRLPAKALLCRTFSAERVAPKSAQRIDGYNTVSACLPSFTILCEQLREVGAPGRC